MGPETKDELQASEISLGSLPVAAAHPPRDSALSPSVLGHPVRALHRNTGTQHLLVGVCFHISCSRLAYSPELATGNFVTDHTLNIVLKNPKGLILRTQNPEFIQLLFLLGSFRVTSSTHR